MDLSKLTRCCYQEKSSNIFSNFHGNAVTFKASYYVTRMIKYSGTSPSCFITAVSYLERFKARKPEIVLNSKTIQRLLLVAVMVASKFLEDTPFVNTRWYV